jgi:meiotically up-regulated gene 157 (Mug157) protein
MLRALSRARRANTYLGFRPSDDACKYPFLVPANMFAVVTLGHLAEIAEHVYHKPALALRQQIDDGIHKHAVVDHPTHGKIYAYETDGRGLHNLMDDANVPSLLSIPYLGYRSSHDPDGRIANNTRRFVLSRDNPHYYAGRMARGVGSPHTRRGWVWHIALTMQALTANSTKETLELIATCENTDGDKGVMHESFNPNKPAQFTRPWFAWANSLFAELVREKLPLLLTTASSGNAKDDASPPPSQ